VIAEADWVVDLGPEAGTGGGRLGGACAPAQLARRVTSHTGQALAPFFAKERA
jgi:excinuclease ABC subunit A